jgi:hypothetical protein
LDHHRNWIKILRKGGRFTAFDIAAKLPCLVDHNNGIVFKGAQIHDISGRKNFNTWYRNDIFKPISLYMLYAHFGLCMYDNKQSLSIDDSVV